MASHSDDWGMLGTSTSHRPTRSAAAALVALLLSGLCAVGIMAAPPAGASTLEILPGASWQTVLSTAPAGSTIVVRAGTHPPQLIKGLALSSVKLVGESKTGTVVRGLQISASSGLSVRTMTVAGDSTSTVSAIRVQSSSHTITLDNLRVLPTAGSAVDLNTGARLITLTNSTVDGRNVTAAGSRAVRIFGDQTDPTKWISDVKIVGNDLGFASGDIIFIAGGRNITIAKNAIHEPQENSDHNDGIQSAGSDNVVIDSNTFWGPGANAPDQAIILGHSPTNTVSKVTRTKVINNVVRDWRGTGIIVSGTDDTLVSNNSVARTGSSTFRTASFATGQPNGFVNSNLRVQNNVFEKIDSTKGPITFEDHNCVRTGGAGANNVAADPQLLDLNKLTLKSTSPCRDRARLTEAPLKDKASVLRGLLPDMGAWEIVV